jgi:hypothetical protein
MVRWSETTSFVHILWDTTQAGPQFEPQKRYQHWIIMGGKEKWSRRVGLNHRPAVYETAALPLSYAGL